MSPLSNNYNLNRAQLAYDNMEPPEEAVVECGDCGKEMSIIALFSPALGKNLEHRCEYPFCPAKFPAGTIERDMAERLLNTEDTLHRCEQRIKFFARQVEALQKGLQK